MAGPWERYQSAGGAQPGLQRVGPANTMRPLQEQGAQLGNQRASQQIAADTQLIPLQVQKARADAARAQAESKKAALDTGLDPQKMANIRAAQASVDRVRNLFIKGPGATKGISSLLDFLPSATNAQFDTAGAGLGEVGLAAFRVPGVGTQTDADLRAFVDANRPRASDFDARTKEKLRNLQSRLDQTYAAYKINRQGGPRNKSNVIDFDDLPE
jgi:hypothetical protein